MFELKDIATQLDKEMEDLESVYAKEFYRLKQIELYIADRMSKCKRLLKSMHVKENAKKLYTALDILSETKNILNKIGDISLKGDEENCIDREVEICDLPDRFLVSQNEEISV